jgi:hypothetical protein
VEVENGILEGNMDKTFWLTCMDAIGTGYV